MKQHGRLPASLPTHRHLLSSALEAAANAIVITDREGRIEWVNPAFTRLTGYTLDEVIGQTPRLLKSGHHDRATYHKLWETVLAGRVWHGKLYNKRKDGGVYLEEQTLTPVQDARGRITHFIAIKQDITDLKRTEEVLMERTRQLEAVRAVTAEITRELDLTRLLDLIHRRAVELVGADRGVMSLWDEGTQTLVTCAWHGYGAWLGEVRPQLGQGVVGRVAQRREGLLVNDYRTSPYANPFFLERTDDARVLCEPLLYHDRLLGVILVANSSGAPLFTDEDQHLLRLFAVHAAIAIENARLYGATERAAREARSLYEVAHSLATSLDSTEVLHLIAAKTTELLGTPHAQVVLWDDATQALRLGAAYGTEADKIMAQQFRLGEGVNGIVAQTRTPLVVNDYQAFAPRVRELTELVAVIGVPLLYRGRFLGVLSTHTTQPGSGFTQEHLGLLTSFADQAAIAIENARLYQQAQEHAVVLEQRVEERTKALKEAQAELVQSAKLAAVGTLAAGVAHELNQPLTVIRGYAQGLLADASLDQEVRADLDRIQAQTGRMAKIINHLRDFSRQAKGTFEPVALNDVIEAAFSLLTQQLRLRNVRVVTDLDPGLPGIRGDRDQLEQVFINLIMNARDAMQPQNGGRLTVTTRGADSFVEAIVADTGPGIPEGIRARIFDPFFTTKEVGQGTGLGLSVSYGILRDHGGEIRAETRPGWGAVFVVRLPMALAEGSSIEHRESRRGP